MINLSRDLMEEMLLVSRVHLSSQEFIGVLVHHLIRYLLEGVLLVRLVHQCCNGLL